MAMLEDNVRPHLMIKKDDIDRLFETISKDTRVKRYGDEDLSLFRHRVLYSALGKWIMFLFADRDFEGDQSNQVTKNHVTISALDIIDSFKKISPEAQEYFANPAKTVNEIERVYISMGYINSGDCVFVYPTKRRKVSFDNSSLYIDLDTTIKKYYGLGIFGEKTEGDTELSDFYLIKENALDYFKKLVSTLTYEFFDSSHGHIDIYNIERNGWDLYNDVYAKKYEYSIVRVDNFGYKVIRVSGNDIYAATLPIIYGRTHSEDHYFYREAWRVILGMCAYNNKPAEAIISDYYQKGIKISLGGYTLPFSEQSILRCSTWPLRNSLDTNELVANKKIENKLIELLEHLSIKVVKPEEEQHGA